MNNGMNRFARLAAVVLSLLAVVALDGCRRRPPATATPGINQDSIDAADRARREALDAERRRLAREDSIRRANERTEPVDARDLMAIIMEPVYFDYDDSALRGDAARGLDDKLPILLANPSLVIRIAGHTDERGSAEYNLALGQRRAASSKRYLVERGVADRRISTISYGEERPVALGEGEAAWSQNRRAEFEVLSGGGNLVRP
jgi:peptidoglycan-associated lipoprotein